MSFNTATYHRQRQLHETSPDLHPFPPALPSLNRSHYGMLLSGNDSEPVLLPAFADAFTKEHCLRSWRLCGAVPLTRSALQNPSVRREVTKDVDTPDVVFVASKASDFDWAKGTLLELEEQNKVTCDQLSKFGLNGEALRLKAPRAPARLGNKISSDATEAERIKALSNIGFNLSSIFHTVGSTLVSSDEISLSAEYKASRERWEKEKAQCDEMRKKKETESVAKEILQQPNAGNFKVNELRKLLKWKLGTEQYQMLKVSKMKKEELDQLWRVHQNTEVDDILVPDLPDEPVLPSLSDTELGKAAEYNALVTANSAKNLSDVALTNLITTLLQQQEARNFEATIDIANSSEATNEEAV